MNHQTDIKKLTREQLLQWLNLHGIKAYRADQIFKWIYLRQVDNFDDMSDISKTDRHRLHQHFTIDRLNIAKIQTSDDGTCKFAFQLSDGNLIETVLIQEKNHDTLCVSTQVGCAQGCRFCRTAFTGFVRNLNTGEIIAQVRDIKNWMHAPQRLTNIVFMGMGEPLANYEQVIQAIRIITDRKNGLQFSNRRVTLSTVGLVPQFPALNADTSVNLAVSLNAADNETRNRLMPINFKYPIEDLIDACRRFVLSPRRRITFEYILIKDVNDSVQDARRLAALLSQIKAKVNLIPYNPHDRSAYDRPEDRVIDDFRQTLVKKNFTVNIRHSKGRDISAACGQLSSQLQKKSPDEPTII